MDQENETIFTTVVYTPSYLNPIFTGTGILTPPLDPSKNMSDGYWFPGENSPYSLSEAVIIVSVLLAIIIGTIIGNVLVCVAVCLVRKLRRPCNYLLVSLAISDICVAVLVMPMATIYEIVGKWTFGPVMCDLWVSFDVLSCTASILNLCMISVDRYYAITKPLQYGVKRTPKRMLLCVGLVWLVAACISLPPLLILGNHHDHDECMVSQNFGYQIYATFGSFYIPLTVMVTVYYKIFRAARRIVLDEKHSRSHLEAHCCLEISVRNGTYGPLDYPVTQQPGRSTSPHMSPSGGPANVSPHYVPGSELQNTTPLQAAEGEMILQTRATRIPVPPPTIYRKKSSSNLMGSSQKRVKFQLAKERKASTTLGIIMSAFTFCWLPFFVLALLRPFLGLETSLKTLSSLFLWLGYANSLLNPIIYATLNRDFRKPFQAILCFKCGSLNEMMREEFYQSQYGNPGFNRANMPNQERADAHQPPNRESFL